MEYQMSDFPFGLPRIRFNVPKGNIPSDKQKCQPKEQITGSTILRVKETKECESFYVYTITQIVYYSMDKYLTKLLKL